MKGKKVEKKVKWTTTFYWLTDEPIIKGEYIWKGKVSYGFHKAFAIKCATQMDAQTDRRPHYILCLFRFSKNTEINHTH